MPSPYRLSDDELLTLAQRLLDNAQAAPALTEALAPFGYDEAAFAEGQTRLDAFDEAVQSGQDATGRKLSATEAVDDAWQELKDSAFTPHTLMARRVIFKGEESTQRRLGLEGRQSADFEEWLQEARRFYRTLLGDADLAARAAERGLTEAKLQDALNEIDALEALDQKQERLKEEKTGSTRQRHTERRMLADWVADFQNTARLALRDRPELAEQLGIDLL